MPFCIFHDSVSESIRSPWVSVRAVADILVGEFVEKYLKDEKPATRGHEGVEEQIMGEGYHQGRTSLHEKVSDVVDDVPEKIGVPLRSQRSRSRSARRLPMRRKKCFGRGTAGP